MTHDGSARSHRHGVAGLPTSGQKTRRRRHSLWIDATLAAAAVPVIVFISSLH